MRRILGFGLLGMAALLLVLELVALADPVGTKMADDSDPFGDPHQPWWFHALWFAIVALLATLGARLIRRSRGRASALPNESWYSADLRVMCPQEVRVPCSTSLAGFVAAALVLLLIPEPGVLYIVARSLSQGHRAGLISVLGLSVGALVHVAAATAGLSAVLLTSATAFGIVKTRPLAT